MTIGDWEARRIADGELAQVGAVLGRAFQDDPMWGWALGRSDTAERCARLARFFDVLVRKVYGAKGLVFTAGDFAGAAVWTPPGAWRFSLGAGARVATGVLGAFGARGTV